MGTIKLLTDRKVFAEWFDSLGEVEWIVLSSSWHNQHIKQIVQRYPRAKVVGPMSGEGKVKFVMELQRGRFDFHTTHPEELVAANGILAADNIEKFVDIAKQDLVTIRHWAAKRERSDNTITSEDLTNIWYHVLHMFVVKLSSGGLLLYAPLPVRGEVAEFAEWFDSLGEVEWIVLSSSWHNQHIKQIVERYPRAKVVGPMSGEGKVKFVMELQRGRFDFHTTHPEELVAANGILAADNIEIFNLEGDPVNAVAVRVDKILLECDLVYGHDDGIGLFGVDEQRFHRCEPEDWVIRMLRFCVLNKPNSPHGFLPNYRYWLMDPNSLGFMLYDAPPLDGSCCSVMANCVRELLKVEFERVLGVHGIDMNREKFVRTIDKSWNWLDGETLLQE